MNLGNRRSLSASHQPSEEMAARITAVLRNLVSSCDVNGEGVIKLKFNFKLMKFISEDLLLLGGFGLTCLDLIYDLKTGKYVACNRVIIVTWRVSFRNVGLNQLGSKKIARNCCNLLQLKNPPIKTVHKSDEKPQLQEHKNLISLNRLYSPFVEQLC